VPRLLTGDQKENSVEINQELLVSANGNENFHKNVTDETSVYGYDVKPRCNRRSGWGKDLLDETKSTDDSVKDQGDAGCVF
jgi:hypothetical protein